jgi:hypothetical protein
LMGKDVSLILTSAAVSSCFMRAASGTISYLCSWSTDISSCFILSPLD